MSNLSFVRHTGDGKTRSFTLAVAGENIGYFRTSDIHGYVDDVEVPITINPSSPHIVTFADAPKLGADILIRRQMPVKKTYADFARGNNFGHRQVNNTFVQQLYLTQEILDGFFPKGFYFKNDIDMGGHRLCNVGDAKLPNDAVTKYITDGLSHRINMLENSVTGNSRFLPWQYNAAGGEQSLEPPYNFTSARLFINGVRQRAGAMGSYYVDNKVIRLAEPLEEGDWIDVELGTEPLDVSGSEEVALKINNLYTKEAALQWRPSLLVNDPLIKLLYNGVEYLPVASNLPFTTGTSLKEDVKSGKLVVSKIYSEITIETVANISDLSLPEGTSFKTKGFYSPMDGGAAEYVVKRGIRADNKLSFNMGNGLVADLVVYNLTIPARQIGINGTDDTKSFIAARDRYAGWREDHTGLIAVDISDVNPVLVTPEADGQGRYNAHMLYMNSGFYITSKANSFFNNSKKGVLTLAPTKKINMGITTMRLYRELVLQNNCGIKNIVIKSNDNVGVGVVAFGCQFGSTFKNIVFSGDFQEHAMIIARSWTATYQSIYVNKTAGAGITIGKHVHFFAETPGGEVDFAVNGMTISDLTVENFGSRRRFRKDVEEHKDYGIGLYGTLHAMQFDGITLGSTKGDSAAFIDHASYGSYKITGRMYVESQQSQGLDVYFSNPRGVDFNDSSYLKATIDGVNLQSGSDIYFKRNNNAYYQIEVLTAVASNKFVVDSRCNAQNIKVTPTTDFNLTIPNRLLSRDKILDIPFNLKDWNPVEFCTEAKYLGITPQVEVYFIPFVKKERVQYLVKWQVDGGAQSVTDGFNEPLEPYKEVRVRGLNVIGSSRVVKMLVQQNVDNCPGRLVAYSLSRDVK